MSRWYVNTNAQANGDHEVHEKGCAYMPDGNNRLYLGEFSHCHAAVRKARAAFPRSNGCYFCSYACHST